MMPARGLPGAALEPSAGRAAARLPRAQAEIVLFLVPLLLAAIVYFPITDNYFFADDFLHFYRIRNEGLLPYLLIPRGGHLLVTSNSVFYAVDMLFGTRPEPYFWLALVTHLVNVGLLFAVIRRFTHSAHLACFGAALWGVSPMNESALGWHSVFGQVLVATVMLFLLYDLGRIADGRPLRRWAPLLWCALLLAACTSFGSGIGLTMAIPVAAFLLLPPSTTRTRVVLTFAALAVIVPGLYFGLTRITTTIYMPRTAPLFFEPNPVTNLLMLANIVGWGIASLVVGQAAAVLDYPSLFAYVVIALFGAGVVVTLLTAPGPLRRRLLACLVLCLGCYGIIVLGRAAFFAMAGRPQAFIRPSRYHYVAPIPLAIALCLILAHAGQRYALRPALKNGLLVAWIAVAGVLYYRFGKPIDHHPHARRETDAVLATIRDAIDAGSSQGVYIPNKPFQSLGPIFVSRQDLFPGWAGVFVMFYPDNTVGGKPVFFVTTDEKALAAAREGRRTATLIVPSRGSEN